MTKQNRAAEAKSDKKSRPKVKPPVVEKLTDDLAGLVQLPGGSIAAADGGTIEAQAARLGDMRLQTVQRQALAAEIGRVQGNRHLQRVVTSVRSEVETVSYQSNIGKSHTSSASNVVMKKGANGSRSTAAKKLDTIGTIGEEILEEGLGGSGSPTMAAA
ncbi:MAG: hypothetical protein GY869_21340, partial [Planctomycetes bacterium]|nr:hypothetical protein [Planctomycetota bacterium]